ncbi:concanavalin A-like lectin/glucanase [Xylaria nigripes]|nr:concanavalin A-like lectin/glucanase [Xylaria nigripes]
MRMRFPQPSILTLGLAAAAAVQAQFLVSELSFGFTGRINDRGEASVPGFSIQGTPNTPEILSNKLILTPPAPGNTRGATWADRPNEYSQWVADIDFRANGGERGGGNLNIWLVRGGSAEIGSSSIYTVNRFDGLALVIDQHGGSGGMIRGFLNDGSVDFGTHHSVDSLAFGHCNYAYRNLGRPSQIKLRQTARTFRVEVDNRLCFESDQITIPAGYYFGITAASPENPDSFEIFKLVVMTENLEAKAQGSPQQQQQQQQQQEQQQQSDDQNQAKAQMSYGRNNQARAAPIEDDAFEDAPADASADSITSSKAQFADLHNRLQSINHHLSTIFRQVAGTNSQAENRHQETLQTLQEIKQVLSKLDRLDSVTNEITQMQRDLQNIKNDLNQKISQSESNVKRSINTNHGNMLEHVATHSQATPGHTKLILIIIGSQFVLVAGYVLYERKKTSPKKYL